MMKRSIQLLSLVIPAHNEQDNIEKIFKAVSASVGKLKIPYEVIFIDDGSTDKTLERMAKVATNNRHCKYVAFTRNFGKEAALTAGLHEANGDAVMMLDADGQHPPELLSKFVDAYMQGSEMVVGIREEYTDAKKSKKFFSKLYAKMFKLLGTNSTESTTDFRLISRAVVNEFKQLQERNRITRGLIDWLGYKPTFIKFKATSRYSGAPSYTTKKLVKLAINSMTSSSIRPLYFSIFSGVLIMFLSSILMVYMILDKYVLGNPLSLNITGTSILANVILFLVGLILAAIGITSVYVARIYEESLGRPLYIIRK